MDEVIDVVVITIIGPSILYIFRRGELILKSLMKPWSSYMWIKGIRPVYGLERYFDKMYGLWADRRSQNRDHMRQCATMRTPSFKSWCVKGEGKVILSIQGAPSKKHTIVIGIERLAWGNHITVRCYARSNQYKITDVKYSFLTLGAPIRSFLGRCEALVLLECSSFWIAVKPKIFSLAGQKLAVLSHINFIMWYFINPMVCYFHDEYTSRVSCQRALPAMLTHGR